ncbi:MAG TPA: hypothetical protein VF223_12975, partial [Trebonia sp.]
RRDARLDPGRPRRPANAVGDLVSQIAISPARALGTIDPKLFGGNARAPGPVHLRRAVRRRVAAE